MAHLNLKKEVTDVVIIGSGAGGGVIAKELSEAGIKVVVLEVGKRYEPHKDFMTDRLDFELYEDQPFLPDDQHRDKYTSGYKNPIYYTRVKGVGGTTLTYVAMKPRLHESDFNTYQMDGVGFDWPINYEDLELYYSKVEFELGVSGPDETSANPFDPPRSIPYPTPAHPFNLASQTVKKGADKLGLHFVREPLGIPTKDWNGRPACINAGTCRFGCKIGAKSSIDVTYIPKAEASGNCTIKTNCMARRINIDKNAVAKSVTYIDENRTEHQIYARLIVVAGNAIETPRLLLMSKSSRFPTGLCNSSGLVGRYLTEHLALFGYALFSKRIDPWRGVPTGGMIQDFYETNQKNQFARGYTLVVSNNHQWPLHIARSIPGWGKQHKDRVREMFGHTVGLASIGEQLPCKSNRVVLDPVVKDNYNLPVPRIFLKQYNSDKRMIDSISANIRSILEAAGADEINIGDFYTGNSSHFFGTCRMGDDPRTSVVDKWCRTHDIKNIFIGDGSVFVSGGAVNPSLTISALATRTAEHVLSLLKKGDI